VSNVTVKVEVWDVVDKGKPKGKPGTLRINFEEEVNVSAVSPNGAAGGDLRLDAETIDVMKGTHAVIFMVDPTKKWTFDYVRREMPKVPPNVWVLIVVCRRRSSCCSCCCCSLTHSRACKSQSNYKDLDDKRVVTDYEIKEFARECGSHVVAAEASMLNRFGVKAIKTLLQSAVPPDGGTSRSSSNACIQPLGPAIDGSPPPLPPPLPPQRNILEEQLRRNQEEIALAEQEVSLMIKEQDYPLYVLLR